MPQGALRPPDPRRRGRSGPPAADPPRAGGRPASRSGPRPRPRRRSSHRPARACRTSPWWTSSSPASTAWGSPAGSRSGATCRSSCSPRWTRRRRWCRRSSASPRTTSASRSTPRELVARVERVLPPDRRLRLHPAAGACRVDDRLAVDFAHQRATVDGRAVALTATETKLLYVLLRQRRPGGGDRLPAAPAVALGRGVRGHPARPRPPAAVARSSPSPRRPRYVVTERGTGYRFPAAAFVKRSALPACGLLPRVALALAAVGLLPLAISSFGLAGVNREALFDQVLHTHTLAARTAADRVGAFLATRRALARGAAAQPGAGRSPLAGGAGAPRPQPAGLVRASACWRWRWSIRRRGGGAGAAQGRGAPAGGGGAAARRGAGPVGAPCRETKPAGAADRGAARREGAARWSWSATARRSPTWRGRRSWASEAELA